MPELFSSPDDTVIQRQIPLQPALVPETETEVEVVFEVERCCQWIRDKGVTRVALQFPDYLLPSAPVVAKLINARVDHEVFVLGDTSYGECCVDEVAADHLNADAVVHFGHTCLTPAQKLPVLYVYTRAELDLKTFKDTLRSQFSDNDDLLLLYDVEYDHLLSDLRFPDRAGRTILGAPSAPDEPLADGWTRRFGRRFPVSDWTGVAGCKVVYVATGAGDGAKMMNFMFSFSGCEFYVYSNSSLARGDATVNRLLRKRYFLIEKTKDATRIGILVGTLGTANYADVIQRLRATITGAGKRAYTFLVGKPNPAKLANFPDVDVFVLVSCPETAFPDTTDFYQPLITPYELDIACNPNRTWGGEYLTDYRELLPGAPGYVEPPAPGSCPAPDVSLVSGRLRGGGSEPGEGAGELQVVNDRTVGLLHAGGGGEFLANRSWSGLEQKLGETTVQETVQGKLGIAAGYTGEPTDS